MKKKTIAAEQCTHIPYTYLDTDILHICACISYICFNICSERLHRGRFSSIMLNLLCTSWHQGGGGGRGEYFMWCNMENMTITNSRDTAKISEIRIKNMEICFACRQWIQYLCLWWCDTRRQDDPHGNILLRFLEPQRNKSFPYFVSSLSKIVWYCPCSGA